MDVPMPAGSGGGSGAAEPAWMAWARERRRLVIAGAFGLAVVLGVVIGLATAPDDGSPATLESSEVAASARSPQLPALPFENSRSPGKAVNMKVGDDLRPALAWATADAALGAAGKTTLSAAVQASASPGSSGSPAVTGGAELTDTAITIPPQQLYYGVIEGVSAAKDVFWAAGLTETSSTAVPVAKLHVWKRDGSGPWTEVASGTGACEKLPKELFAADVWGGKPPLCATSG